MKREVLAVLIQAYEREHHTGPLESHGETFPEYVKKTGFTTDQLAEIIGTKPRVSEVLHGKLGLSVAMIRAFHEEWLVPYDVLVGWTTEALKERKSA
jgi:HTH-type transcriptional regulator / antitoxin HigA